MLVELHFYDAGRCVAHAKAGWIPPKGSRLVLEFRSGAREYHVYDVIQQFVPTPGSASPPGDPVTVLARPVRVELAEVFDIGSLDAGSSGDGPGPSGGAR